MCSFKLKMHQNRFRPGPRVGKPMTPHQTPRVCKKIIVLQKENKKLTHFTFSLGAPVYATVGLYGADNYRQLYRPSTPAAETRFSPSHRAGTDEIISENYRQLTVVGWVDDPIDRAGF